MDKFTIQITQPMVINAVQIRSTLLEVEQLMHMVVDHQDLMSAYPHLFQLGLKLVYQDRAMGWGNQFVIILDEGDAKFNTKEEAKWSNGT
jgi:hypothetical protein